MRLTVLQRLLVVVILGLILLALPGRAQGASLPALVVTKSYTLSSGETLDENLTIIAGTVTLEADSTVTGSILVIGGTLHIAGVVEGDIIATGGSVSVSETGVVEGNITTAGASLLQDEGSVVMGEIRTDLNSSLFTLPNGTQIPNLKANFDPQFQFAGFAWKVVLWALLAMLVAMFLPQRVERVASTAATLPISTGGLGLLTGLVLPLILVVTAITIIGIPVALMGVLAGLAAYAFGMVALSQVVGNRLSLALKQEWHPAIAAGLGALLLFLAVDGADALIPCVGWVPRILVGAVGVGSVLLTRFGSQAYPETAVTMIIEGKINQ